MATAHRRIREHSETLRQEGHFIARLQHQLERLLRLRYGRTAENVDPGQLLLFAPEAIAPPLGPTPEVDAAPAPTPSRPGARKPLLASLPRRRVVHDVAPEHRACPECGSERRQIGEETRDQLE